MTATKLDITIEQGTDFHRIFPITDQGGEAIDLTGYSALMQIRAALGWPSVIHTLTTSDGGLTIDGPDGEIIANIDNETTSAIVAGVYTYDIKLVSPSGKATRPYQGAVRVSGEVTTLGPSSVLPALLLENGGYLLLESGGHLLLEG